MRPIWSFLVNSVSRFDRFTRDEGGDSVTVSVDGEDIQAMAGEPLAAALLVAGYQWFRQSDSDGQRRGPWCMMGACYECLIEVDGVLKQACMTPVTDGMRVSRRLPPTPQPEDGP